MKRFHLFVAFALFFLINLSAQASKEIFAKAVTFAGSDVALQISGSYTTLDSQRDKTKNIQLLLEDLVHTGINSSIELTLLPSDASLYIPDGSSIKLSQNQTTGVAYELLYGRMRLIQSVPNTPIILKTADIEINLDQADCIIEYMLARDGSGIGTTLKVREGSVSVRLTGNDAGTSRVIKAGKAARILNSVYSDLDYDSALLAQDETFWDQRFAPKQEETVGRLANQESILQLEAFSALEILPKDQYIRGRDIKKQLGIVGLSSGSAFIILAAIIGNFGEEFLSLDTSTRSLVGSLGTYSGMGLSLAGATLYMWGLMER